MPFLPDSTYRCTVGRRVGLERTETMLFWLLAITITIIVCAALYYAAAGARGQRNCCGRAPIRDDAHFRLQLERNRGRYRVGPTCAAPEGVAAKAELARELLRQQREAARQSRRAVDSPCLVAAGLDRCWSPSSPLPPTRFLAVPDCRRSPLPRGAGERPQNINLDDAVKTVEARLAEQPR